MIRKVKLPIKFKLIVIINVLLILSLTFYLVFALDLFKKDKSAYIYDTSLSSAEHLRDQINIIFENNINLMVLLTQSYLKTQDPQLMESIFVSQSGAVEFCIYKFPFQNELSLVNARVLESYGLKLEEAKEIFSKSSFLPEEIKGKKVAVLNYSHIKKIPHLLMGLYSEERQEIYTVRVMLKDLTNLFQSNIFDNYLIDQKGELYIHKDLQRVFKRENAFKEDYLKDIVQARTSRMVREVTNSEGQKLLVASSKVDQFNLFVVSEIEKKKAFTAAAYLINKSVIFGIFIIAVSMVIGILFSRSFTSPIDKLFQATQSIAEGDFQAEVNLKSHDELGALADSFNYMGREIVRYMEEMKEKARIENEIKVAQVVQASFFPQSDISVPGLDMSAYYTPATECGGDWWGHLTLEQESKVILFMADATGHGVPAALLTATAHCCLSNLQQFAQLDTQILNSPSRILQFMNQAVANAGAQVTMTCFVAIIYLREKIIKYSNASHNPPFLYRQREEEPTKEDFRPLLGAQGPRLGHQRDGVFQEELAEFESGDVLILYTDGVVDCVNAEGKSWGSRKFLKSLVQNIRYSPQETRDRIVADLESFRDGHVLADDMTLLVNKLH